MTLLAKSASRPVDVVAGGRILPSGKGFASTLRWSIESARVSISRWTRWHKVSCHREHRRGVRAAHQLSGGDRRSCWFAIIPPARRVSKSQFGNRRVAGHGAGGASILRHGSLRRGAGDPELKCLGTSICQTAPLAWPLSARIQRQCISVM
jgi:hypothetical protein